MNRRERRQADRRAAERAVNGPDPSVTSNRAGRRHPPVPEMTDADRAHFARLFKNARFADTPSPVSIAIRWMIGTVTKDNIIPMRDGAGDVLIFTNSELAHATAKQETDAVTPEERELFEAVNAIPNCAVFGIGHEKWVDFQKHCTFRLITTEEDYAAARASLREKLADQLKED